MRLTLALAAAVLAVPVPAAAAAEPAEGADCAAIDENVTERLETDAVSLPAELLGIGAAHGLFPGGGLPGTGVKVAVVDSGVYADSDLLDVEPGYGAGGPAPGHYHGTAVAGLVAGKARDGGLVTGVAPGATIVDVRVYGADSSSAADAAVAPGDVVAGLRWLVEETAPGEIDVVVIALAVEHSRDLEKLVRRLHEEKDAVVVAASGNRPDVETDPLFLDYAAGPLPGEDAADDVFPAGYDAHVLAVGATGDGHPDAGFDARTEVLQSTAIDVAAPTYGGVSLAVNGSTCLLRDVATSWAAAEVAGVVALLRDRFPRESADQVVARLVRTAGGSPEDRNPLTGAGTVQPVEALTRPLTPDRSGRLDGTTVQPRDVPPATAPQAEADVLADARGQAVWWGLLAGGALVLGLVLRPLLARRAGD